MKDTEKIEFRKLLAAYFVDVESMDQERVIAGMLRLEKWITEYGEKKASQTATAFIQQNQKQKRR